MDSRDIADATERDVLSPKELTERINEASEGAKLLFNDHEEPLEVVAADRYSVTVVDSRGNEFTISQNLQTGAWNVHQALWWIQTVEES